jgi:hypothetical protein
VHHHIQTIGSLVEKYRAHTQELLLLRLFAGVVGEVIDASLLIELGKRLVGTEMEDHVEFARAVKRVARIHPAEHNDRFLAQLNRCVEIANAIRRDLESLPLPLMPVSVIGSVGRRASFCEAVLDPVWQYCDEFTSFEHDLGSDPNRVIVEIPTGWFRRLHFDLRDEFSQPGVQLAQIDVELRQAAGRAALSAEMETLSRHFEIEHKSTATERTRKLLGPRTNDAPEEPTTKRVRVDHENRVVIVDGKPYGLSSDEELEYLEILAQNLGQRMSDSDVAKQGKKLAPSLSGEPPRFGRIRKNLPPAVKAMLVTEQRFGTKLVLPSPP